MINRGKPNPFSAASTLLKGRWAIFVSGFSMLMVQVVLLRELTSLFVVNELIVGVFLSFWMLFTGGGALTARFFRGFRWRHAGLFPLISGITALFSLWTIYFAKLWVVADGAPGISDWLLATVLVTFVFCFPTGMMFTWFSTALSNNYGERHTERVYISEQWGSLLAGVLFYLTPVIWLNAFSALTLVVILNFLTALFLFAPVRKGMYRSLAYAGVLLVLVLWFSPQYHAAREMISEGRQITKTFFSPHGSINVIGGGEDREYFGDGRFFSGGLMPEKREELLHPALMLHPAPKRILLINAKPGLVGEALKYDSLEVEFISPDKALVALEKEFLEVSGHSLKRVTFIDEDPLRFLKKSGEKSYDVVLLGGGIPYNLASTRFYTTDFFELIAANLAPEGLMVTGGVDYSESLSKPRLDILRVLDETVGAVFPWRRIWAGNKVFLVASREKISGGWWDYHAQALRQNKFIRDGVFPDEQLKKQIAEIENLLDVEASKNTRVRPVLFQLALSDMSNFWDIELYWFAVVVGVLLLAGLIFFRESARGVFLTGMVLGGMQVVLLLHWQLIMGNLFRATGLLFSFFMAGLAIGAMLGHRNVLFFKARYFPVLLIMLSVLVISAVPLLDTIGHSWFFPLAVLLFVFAFSVLGGAVFVAGISLFSGSVQKGAAVVYGADVAGGAIGSFLAAIFLVPYSGLINAGYLMGVAVLIGGLLLLKRF